ncbi:MAG: hypothetical protein KC502_09765 [Myxococcales bacterium]|nr:hypothetical protein [Myxococcales bacterium]
MADKKLGLTRGVKGSAETNRELADIEQRMMKVKRAFEMYFSGVEKVPPLREFERLKRDVRAMTGTGYATATLRFKVQSLIARFNQYRNLWERQLRKFEDGTYRPGVGAAPGRGPRGGRGRS